MSDDPEITFRYGEVNDFTACLPLIQKNYGSTLFSSPHFQSQELYDLYADNVMAILALQNSTILGGVSIVQAQDADGTSAAEVCRSFLADPENDQSTAAQLVGVALSPIQEGLQWCIFDCIDSRLWQEAAEANGFLPVGYCPGMFQLDERSSAVSYYRLNPECIGLRRPAPELIPGVEPLARHILEGSGMKFDAILREDALAYPGIYSFEWKELDYMAVAKFLQDLPPCPQEIAIILQDTITPFKIVSERFRFFGVYQEDRLEGVIGCVHDTLQQTVTVTHIFSTQAPVKGWLCKKLIEEAAGWPAVAVQVIVSAFASRLQKTFSDLGFVPSSYYPAYFYDNGQHLDAVKMIKLMIPSPSTNGDFTEASGPVVSLIKQGFSSYQLGLTIVNMMKDLRAFRGLGDGEIMRIMDISEQKLFRKGTPIFSEGDMQLEMYIVIRGEVHIKLASAGDRVLDTLKTGSIFGELAFLNGEPRTAAAIAATDSLLLIIRREEFDKLVELESHLGLTVYKNISIDLSEKLRSSTAHLFKKQG